MTRGMAVGEVRSSNHRVEAMTLADAVERQLGVKIDCNGERHELEGWNFQAETPLACRACGALLLSFRCPYSTARGEYRYWALICPSCRTAIGLDVLDKVSVRQLRQWDSGDAPKRAKTADRLTKRAPGGERPTEEQQLILDCVLHDNDVSINALAGTGKTTTLRLIAEGVSPRHGHYIAFNRAIVDEAREKFPSTVDCTTAHGLAFRAIGHRYKGRLADPRVSAENLATHFGVKAFAFDVDGDSFEFEPAQMARLAERTVFGFCKSIDKDIEPGHAPTSSVIPAGSTLERGFQAEVAGVAKKMWLDLIEKRGRMRFVHDHYLKMWQLTTPTIPGDILLFDEAQDADPVMLDVVNSQDGSQLVYCGDTYQSIYEWRGAIDALRLVNVDKELWLTQSFRFGDAIAAVANDFLSLLDAPEKVRGLNSVDSRVGTVADPAAILCRTNFGVMVNLMEAQSRGRRTALLGKVRDGLREFARGCIRLERGQRTGHPELAPFKDWQAALKWAYDEEESLSDTAMLIRLVNGVGAGRLLKTLDGVVDESRADVVVSTAHRAKGREWDSVRLAGDYHHPDDMSDDELKLTYVSVTRARRELDISALPKVKGETPALFENYWRPTSSSVKRKRQRPPIGLTSIAPRQAEKRGVVGRLLGRYPNKE